MLKATARGKLVAYRRGLVSIKSLDPLITWSCKITWQTKSNSTTTADGHHSWQDGYLSWGAPTHIVTWLFVDMVVQNTWCLWPLNLARWWLSRKGCATYKVTGLLPIKLWDHLTNIKLLHHHYDHRTWQDVDLPWGVPTLNVTWSFNHGALWGHKIN